jgi:plastocyanin
VKGLLVGVSVLAGLMLAAAPALAANQTVTANSANQFTPASVTVNQGEIVTWNNTGGLHNVHFDDNSYVQPPTPQVAPWTVSRTFNSPGSFRYYCEAHGGAGGLGMSGVVNVTGPGYPRPAAAAQFRVPLVVAYRQCSAATANRTHGPGLSGSSCNPPTQSSNHLTVGTLDANGKPSQSAGFLRITVCPNGTTASGACSSPAGMGAPDVRLQLNTADVRRKSDLADYTGQLLAATSLRITDKHNSTTPGETGDAATTQGIPFSFTVPCAATPGPADVGSTCSVLTSASAVRPGSVVPAKRAIWEVSQIEVFDGGPDGQASTAGNTLFETQGVFIP